MGQVIELHPDEIEDHPSTPSHPAGKVTAFDEQTGLPIVRRENVPRGTTEQNETKKAHGENHEAQSVSSDHGSDGKVATEKLADAHSAGRDVLHQSTDRAELVSQAKAHARQFEDGIKSATRGIAGARFDAVRDAKDPKRLDEKINDEKQPIETIPDILAGRVGVDSHEAHEKTAKSIGDHFKVVRDEDEFRDGDPKFGYRVHKMQVQVTPQLSGEVHIVPREVLEVNDKEHEAYKQARDAEDSGDEADEEKAAAKAKRINDAAMAKFDKRNEAPVPLGGKQGVVDSVRLAPKLARGQTVLLGDSHGIVRGGNPNFSNGGRWSVETPEGTRTVKGSELTAVERPKPEDGKEYTAFDLDGTLASYDGFKGPTVIGKPIPAMIDRVKAELAAGKPVRIFTARVNDDPKGIARAAIEAWLHRNVGQALPITDRKDHFMKTLYDDRAHAVEANTGKVLA